MISTYYALEIQHHEEVGDMYLIMYVESGSMGVEHFKKQQVDFANSKEEGLSMVAHMNARLQAC